MVLKKISLKAEPRLFDGRWTGGTAGAWLIARLPQQQKLVGAQIQIQNKIVIH